MTVESAKRALTISRWEWAKDQSPDQGVQIALLNALSAVKEKSVLVDIAKKGTFLNQTTQLDGAEDVVVLPSLARLSVSATAEETVETLEPPRPETPGPTKDEVNAWIKKVAGEEFESFIDLPATSEARVAME